MGKTDSVLKRALKKITPSEKEAADTAKAIERIEYAATKVLKKKKLTFTLAGSFLRNTWMPHKKEFDLFILFPEDVKRHQLEKKGLAVGKEIIKSLKGSYNIAYAEHPYVRGHVIGYDIDIVPCYRVSDASNIKSAVDRTPFHNIWLSKNFSRSYSGETRLLKQFLKAGGLYGSDTKTLGFSGYLCELLIVYYKKFNNLVKKAAKWDAGRIFIDIESHHVAPELAKKRYKSQPLMVIDPVDPNRNVAASISPENFIYFVNNCKEFLKKPGESYFFPKPKKPVKFSEVKKRGTLLLGVEFKKPDIIDDVLYPQLRRSARRIRNLLDDYDFQVLNHGVFADKECMLLFELEVWTLPPIRKLRGPSIFVKKHSLEFLNKYKSSRVSVEGDYWTAEVSRRYAQADALLKSFLRNNKNSLKEMGIASYIAESISRKHKILKGGAALKGQMSDFFRKEVKI
jgi:tRNA nucleotidyltransferase (CCA-adding enzyme)